MGIIIDIAKFVLNLIYYIFKMFPTKNKVTFLSRQSNEQSIDYTLLIDELKKVDSLEIKVLTKKIEKGIYGKVKYALHIFNQMYHVATSKVVIIDGYQIVISVLKHKKTLFVIQIWHALGALKKFGYSVKDKKEGSNSNIIEKMNMHKNYNVVLSSSKLAAKGFKEAFNVSEDIIKIIPLPRVDFLLSDKYKNETQTKIYNAYGQLKNGKKNIVYVPTFRKGSEVNVKDVINKLDYSKYNLILKLHHGQEEIYVHNSESPITGSIATGMEFLHIADIVITDYSAITYEASLINKPIYFYVYDFDEYTKNRDFYLDYKKEMPGVISTNIEDLIKAINNDIYYEEKQNEFVKKYIEVPVEGCTKALANIIVQQIKD